jgi:hypothetical protein
MNHQTGSGAQDPLTRQIPNKPPQDRSAVRRTIAMIVPCLFAVVVGAGCASTKVTKQERLVTEQLPRPAQIWVYDFAATAADVPGDSVLTGQHAEHTTPQTAEEIETGRQLGRDIAAQLVEEISLMGLDAEQATTGTKPQINDLVIRGYLLAVDEGSAAKRVVVGFGAGASKLTTAVEGFQMTAQGLRKLGSGQVDAGGSKGPGAALGVAGFIATANPAGLIIGTGMKVYGEASGSSKVEGRAKATAQEIAKVLKQRFQDQGWIR